jgi:DNA-directed RNA polymerase subunit E'/Rpb7
LDNQDTMAEFQKKKSAAPLPTKQSGKIYGVYIRSILNQKVSLLITEIGQNIREILEKKLVQTNEGKCIREGYIKPGSVNIISYSSGLVNSEWIVFETVFECMVSHPVEGMIIKDCVVKTITKAGIHAEVVEENDNVPVVVFVAKDHHNMIKQFNSIVENQKITVKVIGTRFELNDPHISVIAQLVDDREREDLAKTRQKMGGGLAKLHVHSDSEDDE